MKVLILNDFAEVNGGTDFIAIESAIALAQKGHKVLFIYSVKAQNSSLKNENNIRTFCINTTELKKKNLVDFIWNGISNSKTEEALSRLVEEFRPDRTFVHGWTKGLTLSIFKVLTGIENVKYFNHDYFLFCPNGAYYNFKKRKSCKCMPLSARCLISNCDSRNYLIKLFRYLRFSVLLRILNKSAARIRTISVSVLVQNTIRKINRYTDHKDIVLPNFIKAHDAKKSEPWRNHYYLWIGRMVQNKGIREFVQAAKLTKIPTLIIGSGDYERYARQMLPDCKITGWLGVKDKYLIMEKGRFLISTTWAPETFGLITLEAFSMGIPALIPNSSASTDFVIDGYNGYIYDHDRKGDLERAINKIKSLSDNELEVLSQNAYQSFMNFPVTYDNYIEKLLTLC